MEDEYNYIQGFFDFKRLFKEVRINTIEMFGSANELIEDLCIDNKEEIKGYKDLYNFILDKEQVKRLHTEFEISEDQDFNLSDNELTISFTEDTSTNNEGGEHLGGYEYLFTINTEMKAFVGFEIVNHN